MPIENMNEIVTYFEENKDNQEVKNYLQGLAKPTLDGVKSFLETDENGKKYLNSYADSRVTQGIETFKQKNLAKLVEEEILKRNPSTDPKDLKIQELQDKFDALEKEKVRESNLNKGLKLANEKKLPVDIIPFFIGESEEVTVNNLSSLEKSMQAYTKIIREEILKSGSYTPPNGDKTPKVITKEVFDKMGYSERVKLATEQPELYKELVK